MCSSDLDGFVARAADVATMLCAPDARFVVVTTVEEPALGDATRLADELRTRSYPLAAIVANRVLPSHLTPESLTAAADALTANASGIAESALASVVTAARDAAALADAQRVALTAFRAHAPALLLTPLRSAP